MSIEAMKLALEALNLVTDLTSYDDEVYEAIDTLRTAIEQAEKHEPVAMKFQIYKQTPPRGRELKPINSALLPWVYDQDPSSGNTASMWVTPVATLPPKKEWVGLTGEELKEIYQCDGTVHFKFALIEAKLKEKNAA